MQKGELNERGKQALQKIARGTGIVFAGTVISMFSGCPNERLMNNTPRTSSGGIGMARKMERGIS